MTPAIVISAMSLLILYTVTVLGGAAWLMNQLKGVKTEILADFNSKHEANNTRYEALNTLVQRHDILLSPEFSGKANGKHHV